MIWHVVFAELDGRVQSRAARSRDAGIRAACELMSQGHEVRRIVEPNGAFIESSELVEHFDEGRFPGLRQDASTVILGLLPRPSLWFASG